MKSLSNLQTSLTTALGRKAAAQMKLDTAKTANAKVRLQTEIKKWDAIIAECEFEISKHNGTATSATAEATQKKIDGAKKAIDMTKVNAKSAAAKAIVTKDKKSPKVTHILKPELTPEQEYAKLTEELKDAQAKVEAAKTKGTKNKYAKLVETISGELAELASKMAPEVIDVTDNVEVPIPVMENGNMILMIDEKDNAEAAPADKAKLSPADEGAVLIVNTIADIFEEMAQGSAPMTEKVRLGDLPIDSCYQYRAGGAKYILLEVNGMLIRAAEANGKEFTAKAANYKVFKVQCEEAK